MCARTSKKTSAGEYCRQWDAHTHRKKMFAGWRLAEIKRKVLKLICLMQEQEQERRTKLSSCWCTIGNFFFVLFFLSLWSFFNGEWMKNYYWRLDSQYSKRTRVSIGMDELRVEKRNKKKKKKTTLTLPSVKAKCVTSNQIWDEDWLVDDDLMCDMSKKKKTKKKDESARERESERKKTLNRILIND